MTSLKVLTRCRSKSFGCLDKKCARFIKFLRLRGCSMSDITEGFQFLGYRIVRTIGARGSMVPKVHIPESAIKRFQHATRRILAPRTTSESTVAKIQAMNQLTRGWCGYYRSTSSPSLIFNKLDKEVFDG